jgi:Domain of unknown function (DUF4426)
MISKAIWVLLALALASGVNAQTDVQQQFGNYNVNYSVFNSNFIDPEIAALHHITRGDNIALVNIAVTRANAGAESLGLPIQIDGRVQNLLMQSRPLEFSEIHEGQAYYYLASFRIDNEDPQHFFINVTPPGARTALAITFTRTLYTD